MKSHTTPGLWGKQAAWKLKGTWGSLGCRGHFHTQAPRYLLILHFQRWATQFWFWSRCTWSVPLLTVSLGHGCGNSTGKGPTKHIVHMQKGWRHSNKKPDILQTQRDQNRHPQVSGISSFKKENQFILHCLAGLNQGHWTENAGKHILSQHNDELANDEWFYTREWRGGSSKGL